MIGGYYHVPRWASGRVSVYRPNSSTMVQQGVAVGRFAPIAVRLADRGLQRGASACSQTGDVVGLAFTVSGQAPR